MSIRVIKSGLLSSVQDGGRHGYASLGVGSSGAMDTASLQLANALVGNGPEAAAIEITVLGPLLEFTRSTRIALCGAELIATLDHAPLAMWRPVDIEAGCVLDASRMRRGARAYLAVAGGIDVARILGSCASDINAGIGHPPLRNGEVLECGAHPTLTKLSGPAWSLDPRPWFDADPSQPVHLIRGPHFEALDADSRKKLFNAEFRITMDSNRVGFRLEATTLTLQSPLELISEPVTAGSLQLPPSGQPIALMAEHPTTGGYPRIGQVAAIDLPRLAQRRPGDRLRFAEISIDDAQSRYLARRRELALLVGAIRERLQ